MSFVSCSEVDAAVAELQAQIDALAAQVPVSATTEVEGLVELATTQEVSEGNSYSLVVTPGTLVDALGEMGTPSALQQAVVDAVQNAISIDSGAQQAITNAIVDEMIVALDFSDCNGDAIEIGDSLVTCENLTDALSGGFAPIGPAGGGLTGTYPNPGLNSVAVVNGVEAGIAGDVGAQIAITNAIVDEMIVALDFESCKGLPIEIGESLATCADLEEAIFAGTTPIGPAGGGLTGNYPNPGLSTTAVVNAVESGIAADLGAQTAIADAIKQEMITALNFRSCGGALIDLNASISTCAELTAVANQAAGGALTGNYPNPGLVPSAVATAFGARDCNGAAIGVGASLATCANLAAAIASIDGDETRINAGSNINVTGTGTAANPYTISLAGGGVPDLFAVGSYAGLGFAFIAGDLGSPYPGYPEAGNIYPGSALWVAEHGATGAGYYPPPGTWKLMGSSPKQNSDDANTNGDNLALFVRVA